MATVAADAILGYATGRALRLSGRWTVYLILMANSPDFDYVPGLLVGDPDSTHRNIGFHTPYFAAGIAVVATLAYRWRRPSEGWSRALWVGSLSGLMAIGHLVLDQLELPYWHATGWMALPAEAVNSVVDTLVIGPVIVTAFWIWHVRFAGAANGGGRTSNTRGGTGASGSERYKAD
ncbi:MAG TPA: hypothetical protein VNL92_07525 [Dehalococcoidia bacterium]|nr:hypothetical protein [Dehalococcoidia bacterium]